MEKGGHPSGKADSGAHLKAFPFTTKNAGQFTDAPSHFSLTRRVNHITKHFYPPVTA